MEQTPSRQLVRILPAGLIVCIALLVYALWRMDSLSERFDGLDQRLGLTSRDVQQTTSDIQARADELESRVASLEQSAGISPSALQKPSLEQLDLLLPGLYELETSTQYDPEFKETSPYTISHVVMEMRYEDYGSTLHVGMATSGMVPKGAYFDYDNDGQIDVDMALNFVRDIPVVGRSLAKAYNPEIGQNLYSIFVSEAENAEYTSVDDMSEDAEAASSYIWKFVMDQYESIEAWVIENLPDQQTEG